MCEQPRLGARQPPCYSKTPAAVRAHPFAGRGRNGRPDSVSDHSRLSWAVPLFTAEESSQRCRGACALHCVSTWASPIRRSTDCSRGSRLMVPDWPPPDQLTTQ